MPTMPVLVIGIDATWRSRMQRLLGARCEFDWLGAYAPAQKRRSGLYPPAVLLLDGDDPRSDRAPRHPSLPAPRRLYFYRYPTVGSVHHCMSVGAHGCLDKQALAATVLGAVRAVESGLFVLAPGLLHSALECAGDTPVLDAATADWSRLTGRQSEILRWAARGMSNKEIARQLDISPETVKTHLHHMFEREGIHGRTALVAAYLHESSVAPDDAGASDDGHAVVGVLPEIDPRAPGLRRRLP